MTNFRMPGVLGDVISLDIDRGTLVRAASFVPVPTGVEDYLKRIARREIKRAVVRGVEVISEAAYRAAREELYRLKGDIDAQLEFIASLPDEIRDRVAYECFAAGFDHYLPKKFLHKYIYGKGASYTLTQQEMIDCNPYITLLRSKAFNELLAKSKANAKNNMPEVSALDINILSGALTNGTLGQFTVKAKGKVSVKQDGTWFATGTMSFYDEWDFDPKDFKTGGRSFQGEVKTRIGNAFLPGQGFKIFSETVPFSQSQNDATVVWAGGAPDASPDRIAKLDVELSKPDK